MIDWEVTISVMLALFLFNVLKGSLTLVFGLLLASKQELPSPEASSARGDFLSG